MHQADLRSHLSSKLAEDADSHSCMATYVKTVGLFLFLKEPAWKKSPKEAIIL